MANSELDYASRRPKYPSYIKTSNYFKSQALNISSKISDLQEEVSCPEFNGNQDFEFSLSSTDHNGIAFKRMDGKPEILREVYNSLDEEKTPNSRIMLENLGNNMTTEPYSRIPISSHSRSFKNNNCASKNEEESTALIVNGRKIKHRDSSEFLTAKNDYEGESPISKRDGSPSSYSIISSKQDKRYSRRYSTHVSDIFEAQATKENAENTLSEYETNRSRKEKILDFDRPLFAVSNAGQKLSGERRICADKLDKNITTYSDQNNLSISKPVAYSKANKTSGYFEKCFFEDLSLSSKGMADAIVSISAEYERRIPIESKLRSISRGSGSSTSIPIQHKNIVQRSRDSNIYPEVYDDIDISSSNLTTSPTLNINLKKSDINDSLVTRNALVPESGNVRKSKSRGRDHHQTHPMKTNSNSMNNPHVKYQTKKLKNENENENEIIFDSQNTRHVDGERNKTTGEYHFILAGDDDISDKSNDIKILTPKKSDIKDENSKHKANVLTTVYVESRESDSERKILQDLAMDYQATNSPPKTHESVSPKINYQPFLETGNGDENLKVDKESSSPEIKSVGQKTDFFLTDHYSGKSQEAFVARCLSRSSYSKSPEGNVEWRASNDLCPPSKSDTSPEERDDTRDIKQEFLSVEKRNELNSACLILSPKLSSMKWDNNNQTPKSKANILAIQTPRVIGAYIETPMPCINPDSNYDKSIQKHAFSLESHRLKWETISDLETTSSQSQDPSQFKFSQKDMNIFNSKQIPINTAPRISASEDLRLIKIEQNIEDSVMDSYLQEALNNIDAVTDIDYSISNSENDKSVHVENEDSKSEPSQTQRELYVDNIMIERLRRMLDSTTDSINATKRGIERLEKQFSTLSSDNISKFNQKNDTLGARLLSWFIVQTSSPRPQEPVGFFLNRNWKLTWLGFIISIIFVWYLSELAMCEVFCHPECSNTNTWQPSDPFFPWAIPTKLDQWTGNNVSKVMENLLNWFDPYRNTRNHWPKHPYSGYDWWGGNFGPAPLRVLNPTDGGLGNIDDDNEVNN